MTVAFRHSAELEAGGTAAYLRLVPGPAKGKHAAGLLQLNARGEPVEFTYSQVDEPESCLWDPRQLALHLQVELCKALFQRAIRSPLLLLYLGAEVPEHLFNAELELTIPAGQVMVDDGGFTEPPKQGEMDPVDPHLSWHPSPPPAGSAAGNLLAALRQRHLLREPFDRIPSGLSHIWSGHSTACLP